MILHRENIETDSFIDINNDIFRIVKALNKNQRIKRLLTYTGKEPLQEENDITEELIDKQICRVPLIPFDENEGSICVVSVVKGDVESTSDTINMLLAIDVFTPGNQWIINEGIRPLMIAHEINNTMKYTVNQTGGIKYRLGDFVSAQLSDVLLGYRLLFEVVIDD